MLLPPDLRDRVPADHLVHFVIEATGDLDGRTACVNEQGCGSKQYPPAMMLGLLIYSYNLRRLHTLAAVLNAA